jgi:abequosyltransferase
MPQDGPTLSIGIPTYNRCSLLNRELRTIAQQLVAAIPGQVEVIVSDNASVDETPQIVARFTREYPAICFRSFRQPYNIGVTRNINVVEQAASGKFVYLLADDDILLPGALEAIIAAIHAYPTVDVICPRVSGFSALPEAVRPRCVGNDELVIERDQALIRLGTMLTFISSVVFRKSAICAAPTNNDTFVPQSFMFLAAIAREKGCLFLAQECLAARGNEAIGYDFIRAFVTDFDAVLRFAEQLGFSSQAVRRVLAAHAQWVGGCLRHFRRTSYRPHWHKRIRDTLTVTRVWWWDPVGLFKIAAAIWLPLAVYDALAERFRSVRQQRASSR